MHPDHKQIEEHIPTYMPLTPEYYTSCAFALTLLLRMLMDVGTIKFLKQMSLHLGTLYRLPEGRSL